MYEEKDIELVAASIPVFRKNVDVMKPAEIDPGHFACQDWCSGRVMSAAKKYRVGRVVDFERSRHSLFDFLYCCATLTKLICFVHFTLFRF